jgi:hypothetical protein
MWIYQKDNQKVNKLTIQWPQEKGQTTEAVNQRLSYTITTIMVSSYCFTASLPVIAKHPVITHKDQIVLPLSDSMSVSTFSKFLWASGKPTCSCHIFYTNRRFSVCGYRHLAETNWGCRGWQYYYLPRRWIFGVVEGNVAIVKVMWPLIWPILYTYI